MERKFETGESGGTKITGVNPDNNGHSPRSDLLAKYVARLGCPLRWSDRPAGMRYAEQSGWLVREDGQRIRPL